MFSSPRKERVQHLRANRHKGDMESGRVASKVWVVRDQAVS